MSPVISWLNKVHSLVDSSERAHVFPYSRVLAYSTHFFYSLILEKQLGWLSSVLKMLLHFRLPDMFLRNLMPVQSSPLQGFHISIRKLYGLFFFSLNPDIFARIYFWDDHFRSILPSGAFHGVDLVYDLFLESFLGL